MVVPPWTTLLTAAVALYGAVLSTVVAVLSWREKRTHLKVVFAPGYTEQGPQVSEVLFFISVANHGSRPVKLTTPGVRIKGKEEKLYFRKFESSPQLPCEVAPGHSCEVMKPAAELAASLRDQAGLHGKVRIAGFVTDAIGRRHSSKWTVFSVEEWAGLKR